MTTGTHHSAASGYPLVRLQQMSVDEAAVRTGLHPGLLRRYVALGLLQGRVDGAGQMWVTPDSVRVVSRVRRLRSSLSLNYAAVGLVLDLLSRIETLEAQRCRHQLTGRGHQPWT